MKKIVKLFMLITALVLLLATFGAQAAADAETVNILLIVGDGTYGTFYPSAAAVISLDFTDRAVRVINFDMGAQINAVTPQAGETVIPMSFLQYCDTDAIVSAYETTFGVTMDRYLFLSYQYGSFDPMISAMDMLCPVTMDIPEVLLGDEEYASVNGNMPWIAGELGREYTLITGTEAQTLDAVGVTSFFAAFPSIDYETVDWLAYTMDDLQLWDLKGRSFIEGLRPVVAQMDADAALAFWSILIQGQVTDITQDDIAAWSQTAFAFPDDAYLMVPAADGAEAVEIDASAYTSADLFPHVMVTYDTAAAAAAVQAFVAGE